jgi:hypothetical protein
MFVRAGSQFGVGQVGRPPARRPFLVRRGLRGTWAPDCAAAQCTGAEVQSWCNTAPAYAPLSYVLCLPQDVTNVVSEATYGTTFTTPPPGGAPPGAPTATQLQENLPGGSDVVGSDFTPLESAQEAATATAQDFSQFLNTQAGGGNPAGTLNWWEIAGIALLVVGAVYLLIPSRKR